MRGDVVRPFKIRLYTGGHTEWSEPGVKAKERRTWSEVQTKERSTWSEVQTEERSMWSDV